MSSPENSVQVSNEKRYFSPKILRAYTTYDLMRAEAVALLKYQPHIAQKSVLDIGIGTGRTTVYLAPLAKDYVGIDFSPRFIDFVGHSMPDVSIKLCDMRDLSDFDSEQFDFVMGSYNVFDVVGHDDRLQTLSEVRRVLKPGGVLMFSSHNRAYEFAGRRPRIGLEKDPIRQAREIYRSGRRWRNYLKWKKHRIDDSDYSIITDEGNEFSTLHYYIDHDSQRRQLDGNGFDVLDVFDIDGRAILPNSAHGRSVHITYVAQKRNA